MGRMNEQIKDSGSDDCKYIHMNNNNDDYVRRVLPKQIVGRKRES